MQAKLLEKAADCGSDGSRGPGAQVMEGQTSAGRIFGPSTDVNPALQPEISASGRRRPTVLDRVLELDDAARGYSPKSEIASRVLQLAANTNRSFANFSYSLCYRSLNRDP